MIERHDPARQPSAFPSLSRRVEQHPTSCRSSTKGVRQRHDRHRRSAKTFNQLILPYSLESTAHRSVVGIRTTFLLSSVLPTPVLPVTPRRLVGPITTSTRTRPSRTCGPTSWTSRFEVGLRHDLRRQVEPFPEVGEPLVGQGVVVVLPRELRLDKSLGGEGLHRLDHFEIANGGHVRVGGAVEILGSDENTLLEERFVDLFEGGSARDCPAARDAMRAYVRGTDSTTVGF